MQQWITSQINGFDWDRLIMNGITGVLVVVVCIIVVKYYTREKSNGNKK